MDRSRYIDGHELRVARPEGSAHLCIEIFDHVSILAARVKRLFPLSHEHEYLSIQDAGGTEFAILRSADGLDEESQRLLAEELDRRYFSPKVSRIRSLRPEAGMWQFIVDTQRGQGDFYVRNWRDSAHEVSPGRWQIHSVDGQRFEIERLEGMDDRSQTLLEQLL
jgi:hypothetical protein